VHQLQTIVATHALSTFRSRPRGEPGAHGPAMSCRRRQPVFAGRSHGPAGEEALALDGHFQIGVPRSGLTATADAPDERASLGFLDDERDRSQRQLQCRRQHLVVYRRVSEVAVSDGFQQLAQPVVVGGRPGSDRAGTPLVGLVGPPAIRAFGAGRRQTTLTFCASSPFRPGATSNSTRWPSLSDL
jgi:hypothetical protein